LQISGKIEDFNNTGDFMIDQWEIYVRSTEGKAVSERDFDMKMLPMELSKLVREYDISYNPEELVPTDKSQVQAIFDAAIDLLVNVGYYNTSTGRIISFEEKEIRRHLKRLPGEYSAGEGNEAITRKVRKLEDTTAPTIIGGAQGGPISSEWYTPIYQSFAMEPCVKELHSGTLVDINGCEIKSKSTGEMLAARNEAAYIKEGIRRAGRPGLGIIGTMSGTTSEAQTFAFGPGGYRPGCDRLLVALLNELKVDWDTLKKAMYCQHNGVPIFNVMSPVMGGYLGGPEGTAVGYTSECIAAFMLLGGTNMGLGVPNDASTGYKIFSESFWALSRTMAALNLNVAAPTTPYCTITSGMGSVQSMVEIAAIAGVVTPVGASSILGACTSTAIEVDSVCGMNSRIMDECARAFTGMSLEEANENVVKLVNHYGGNDIANYTQAPAKKFHELYDLKTVTPSNEFVETWDNAKAKISAMTTLEFND
jgi:methylamine--corrinoid protein Co-methyltransferase